MKRTYSYRINLSDKEESVMRILIDEYNVKTPQELLRTMINERVRKGNPASATNGLNNISRGPGRPKINRDEVQREAILNLSRMDDQQLIEHFLNIEYTPMDALVPDMTGVIQHYRMRTDESGKRFYGYIHYPINDPTHIQYQTDLFDWDELISDLKKQKKL